MTTRRQEEAMTNVTSNFTCPLTLDMPTSKAILVSCDTCCNTDGTYRRPYDVDATIKLCRTYHNNVKCPLCQSSILNLMYGLSHQEFTISSLPDTVDENETYWNDLLDPDICLTHDLSDDANRRRLLEKDPTTGRWNECKVYSRDEIELRTDIKLLDVCALKDQMAAHQELSEKCVRMQDILDKQNKRVDALEQKISGLEHEKKEAFARGILEGLHYEGPEEHKVFLKEGPVESIDKIFEIIKDQKKRAREEADM